MNALRRLGSTMLAVIGGVILLVGMVVAFLLGGSDGGGNSGGSGGTLLPTHHPTLTHHSTVSNRTYTDCEEANAVGVFDIPITDPDYWPGGDRDHDGYACDSQD